MPDQRKPSEDREPIITELAIPEELIEEPHTWAHAKNTALNITLNAMKLIAAIAWVATLLAIGIRLTGGDKSYAFLQLLPISDPKAKPDDLRHLYALIAAVALAVSALGCGIGSALCARGASKRRSEGRLLLFLAVASASMAAVLFFLW